MEQLFYQLLHFHKNIEGKTASMFHGLALSLTFFNTLSHKDTHLLALLIVFHPLTLFLTQLNPHIHLYFLSLSLPELSELSPFLALFSLSLALSSPRYSLFPAVSFSRLFLCSLTSSSCLFLAASVQVSADFASRVTSTF